MKEKEEFDYESKPFGIGELSTSPTSVPALKLKYCFDNLMVLQRKLGRESLRVLEVGCGGGAMARATKSYFPESNVIGCDISQRALKFAQENSRSVKLVYGDVYDLPFEEASFDAVVTFDFLEHLADLTTALSEMKRILVPGGLLYSAIPYEGSLWTLHGWLKIFGWRAKEVYCGHVNLFRLGDPEDLIRKAGFEIAGRRFSTHLFYQIFDAGYFSLTALRRRNFPYQVEGYLAVKKKGVFRNLLFLAKSAIAAVSYFESRVLFWLPGLTGHLTCLKGKV